MRSIQRLSLFLIPMALVATSSSPAVPAELVAVGVGSGDVIKVGVGDDGPVVRVYGDDSAYLGVNIEEEIDHPEGGARITHVVDRSPADEAGLRVDDVVVEFDGHVVRGPAALTRRIHEREPGDRVTLKIIRDDSERTLDVELGRRSDIWKPLELGEHSLVLPEGSWKLGLEGLELEDLGERIREGLAPLRHCEEGDCVQLWGLGWGDRPRLGVQLVEATPELRRHLGGTDDEGVLVSKVLSGTPAERAGIRVGDLIVSVGGETIEDVQDLRRALAGRAGETFTVEVIRDERRRTIEVTLPEAEDDDATGPRAGLYIAPPAPPAAPRHAGAGEVPAPPARIAPVPRLAPRVPAPPAPPPPPVRRDLRDTV
jgi:membrane-associated protease RseP (regulator of RpoE activity)